MGMTCSADDQVTCNADQKYCQVKSIILNKMKNLFKNIKNIRL